MLRHRIGLLPRRRGGRLRLRGRPLTAALAATVTYNRAGAQAAERCSGPGSFQVAFLDALAALTPEEVADAPLAFEEA